MSEIKDKPEIPVSIFKKLNGNLFTLILGMLIVGGFNVMPLVIDRHEMIFPAADSSNWGFNIIILIISAIVLGVLDVLVFGTPLYDVFKALKKEGPMEYTGELRVKLFKVYIIAHLPVLPIQLIILTFLSNVGIEKLSGLGYFLILVTSFFMTIWFYIIISRGVNALYNFQRLQRSLVLPIVLIWSFILGTVLEYGVHTYVVKLLRV